MTAIASVLRRLTVVLDRVAGWGVLPAITVVVLVDVTLRYVFNDPLIWGLEFSRHMLIALFFFALPECTRTHGHIRMELVFLAMPHWLKQSITFAYCVSGVVIFAMLAGVEWEELNYAYRIGRATEYLVMPLWAFSAIKLFASIVLVVLFAFRALGIVLRNDPYPETERDPYSPED